MVDVLESQRAATRFRILVAIADRQPAVSQGEIAEAVGVTSQAVSDYIRDLVDEGYVETEGRGRYRVTNEGVDWLFGAARSIRRYAEHVTGDVLGGLREDAAIARSSIEAGETVSLSLSEGLLHARPGTDGAATGVATDDAAAGEVVTVTGFEGVIDIDPGTVRVIQVGAEGDIASAIAEPAADADLVVSAGVEAVVALRAAGVDYATHFASGEVAADAASRGLDVVVVAATDALGRVTDALRDAGVTYEVTE
ncbi:MAG: MarR family transcriptional regulator [Salinirussus sp.]